MAVTGGPSHPHAEDPKPTEPQEPEQSPPHQPPHSETLDFSNSPQSPLHDQVVQISQQSNNDEDTLMILDVNNQQWQPKHDQKSGITHATPPEPIILINDTKTALPPPAPPLTSPTTSQRRRNKRKKGGIGKNFKNRCLSKKVRNLTEVLTPVPFIPKALDLRKHENVLKRLGLYDFSKIELDRSIRTDLLVQLIVSYDSKKRCSYVNGKRINVNRIDLARALQLPDTKQDKRSSKVEEVDLDSEVFSAEAIGFIEDFVFNWMLLHEESWVMPAEIVNWTRCIRDGHPEKLDSASLIWYKVKKELSQGDKLVDCYYASHLQHLIRSQHQQLLEVYDDKVDVGGDGVEDEENVEADEHEEKEEHGEKEEKASIDQEDDVEMTLGRDVEKVVHQDVREDEMMVEAEECKEDMDVEEMEEHVNRKKDLGEHILQRCQNSDLINNEEIMVEDIVDEQIEQVDKMEEHVNWKDDLGEHILQRCESSDLNNYEVRKVEEVVDEKIELVDDDEEEEVEGVGDDGEGFVGGFDIEANDDLGMCMGQMQQWLDKAKVIQVSKEEIYVNSKYHQDSAMNELRHRHQLMEMIIKSKDEELAQKHAEVYRLERELYLMGDLLAGYRKALKDTRFKFSEYRKRSALQQEPLYKIHDNDASMESVLHDPDESKEKGGGEEH